MKLALYHAFAVVGSLAAATASAEQVPVAAGVAGAAASTEQVPIAAGVATATADTTNANASAHSIGVQAMGHWICSKPSGGLSSWYYNTRSEGPYGCTKNHDTSEWSMLSAYRSGGSQGVHWKYTDNQNDPDCLTNWNYYSNDGQTTLASGIGRTTTQGDSKRWCALPVYRSGGVEGKQWAHCYCEWYDAPCPNCNP